MTNWHPLYIVTIALFVMANVAALSFYLGMRYATPSYSGTQGEIHEGTFEFMSTGGIVQSRSADSISILADDGTLRNFRLSPDTDIHVEIAKEYEWRNIKVGARAEIMVTNGVAESINVIQDESSATSSLQQQ